MVVPTSRVAAVAMLLAIGTAFACGGDDVVMMDVDDDSASTGGAIGTSEDSGQPTTSTGTTDPTRESTGDPTTGGEPLEPALCRDLDVASGITSNVDVFVSLRYMRHLWVTPDGVQVAVVQQGGGGLGLYKLLDDGLGWQWEQDLPSTRVHISDGIMLPDGSLALVTSIAGSRPEFGVAFLRLDYDAAEQQWTLDATATSMVFTSSDIKRASRATLAIDSNGVLWSAFRLEYTGTSNYRIHLFYSSDGGASWLDSHNLFGSPNAWGEKDGRVIATPSGIGVIFQDVTGTRDAAVRSKRWAFRAADAPADAPMESELIAEMTDDDGDPYGSHWSVATDAEGDVHFSYQDGPIWYQRLNADFRTWSARVSLGSFNGSYNSLTLADHGDVWVFASLAGGQFLWANRRDAAVQTFAGWERLTPEAQEGRLRMATPERVVGELPLLYQVNESAPYELRYCSLPIEDAGMGLVLD